MNDHIKEVKNSFSLSKSGMFEVVSSESLSALMVSFILREEGFGTLYEY